MAEFDPTQGIVAAQQMKDAYASTPGVLPWKDSWIDFATQYSLAQQAFENNKEMWNLMNEYNSPSSQMARYKAAGLNPMLMYQQGSSGNASSPVSYSQPQTHIQPSHDTSSQVQQAQQVVSMMNNVVQNIAGMFESSYDIMLKRNQVALSNFDVKALHHAYPLGDWYSPDGGSLAGGIDRLGRFDDKLNIYSPNFDKKKKE